MQHLSINKHSYLYDVAAVCKILDLCAFVSFSFGFVLQISFDIVAEFDERTSVVFKIFCSFYSACLKNITGIVEYLGELFVCDLECIGNYCLVKGFACRFAI